MSLCIPLHSFTFCCTPIVFPSYIFALSLYTLGISSRILATASFAFLLSCLHSLSHSLAFLGLPFSWLYPVCINSYLGQLELQVEFSPPFPLPTLHSYALSLPQVSLPSPWHPYSLPSVPTFTLIARNHPVQPPKPGLQLLSPAGTCSCGLPPVGSWTAVLLRSPGMFTSWRICRKLISPKTQAPQDIVRPTVDSMS